MNIMKQLLITFCLAASAQRLNLAVLTDSQKVKLAALNDAMKLAPVISEAQFGNLLAPANSPPLSFTSFQVGVISAVFDPRSSAFICGHSFFL
jgi:hypothetical protein